MRKRNEFRNGVYAMMVCLTGVSLVGLPVKVACSDRPMQGRKSLQQVTALKQAKRQSASSAGNFEGTVRSVEGDEKSAAAENGGTKATLEKSQDAPVIVIGFVGGFVRKGNAVHSPVKIAASLRNAYPNGAHVEVFENHHREDAYRRILQLLDGRHAGHPSEEERQAARIILYGMSWGGSEIVTLARELERQKIPVLLTIQVDSVRKIGENDGLIPANVAEAVNFYQNDGLLHGRAQIYAQDASRTQILGNFRYTYKRNSLSCKEYPWWDRWLTKYHTDIECDTTVWNRVESLIREKLPSSSKK